jgi:hypothetical protein
MEKEKIYFDEKIELWGYRAKPGHNRLNWLA